MTKIIFMAFFLDIKMIFPFSIHLFDATCVILFYNFETRTRNMIKSTLCVLVIHFLVEAYFFH